MALFLFYLFYFSLNYGKAYEQPLWSFYLRTLIYTREQENGDRKLKCGIRCSTHEMTA